jgi:putative flippase GtrA
MKDLVKFLKYGIGGGLAFITTLSLTYFLTEKIKIYYLISAILGYFAGFLINFTFQAFITFKTKNELYFQRNSWFNCLFVIISFFYRVL